METKKNNTKIIAAAVAVFVILAAAFAVIYFIFSEKPVEGEKNITVDVLLADGTSTSYEINTDAEYLKEAIDGDGNITLGGSDSEYGFMITAVNGVTANDGNQEWWCLTKNGEMLMTGVSTTPINDGDKFEITLTVGYDSFSG